MTRFSFPNSLWRLRTPVPSLLAKSKQARKQGGMQGDRKRIHSNKGKKKNASRQRGTGGLFLIWTQGGCRGVCVAKSTKALLRKFRPTPSCLTRTSQTIPVTSAPSVIYKVQNGNRPHCCCQPQQRGEKNVTGREREWEETGIQRGRKELTH